jgi:hypothetical protein
MQMLHSASPSHVSVKQTTTFLEFIFLVDHFIQSYIYSHSLLPLLEEILQPIVQPVAQKNREEDDHQAT